MSEKEHSGFEIYRSEPEYLAEYLQSELDHDAFLDYIKKWWPEQNWLLEKPLGGSTCTTFPSQALYTAGYPMDDDWFIGRILGLLTVKVSEQWGVTTHLQKKLIEDGWPYAIISTDDGIADAIAAGFGESSITFLYDPERKDDGPFHAIVLGNPIDGDISFWGHSDPRNAYGEVGSDTHKLLSQLIDPGKGQMAVVFNMNSNSGPSDNDQHTSDKMQSILNIERGDVNDEFSNLYFMHHDAKQHREMLKFLTNNPEVEMLPIVVGDYVYATYKGFETAVQSFNDSEETAAQESMDVHLGQKMASADYELFKKNMNPNKELKNFFSGQMGKNSLLRDQYLNEWNDELDQLWNSYGKEGSPNAVGSHMDWYTEMYKGAMQNTKLVDLIEEMRTKPLAEINDSDAVRYAQGISDWLVPILIEGGIPEKDALTIINESEFFPSQVLEKLEDQMEGSNASGEDPLATMSTTPGDGYLQGKGRTPAFGLNSMDGSGQTLMPISNLQNMSRISSMPAKVGLRGIRGRDGGNLLEGISIFQQLGQSLRPSHPEGVGGAFNPFFDLFPSGGPDSLIPQPSGIGGGKRPFNAQGADKTKNGSDLTGTSGKSRSVAKTPSDFSMVRFAEGGRAEEASIFGEAGPEWAIPESHTHRTAELLAAATKASGFSLGEIEERSGGLSAEADNVPPIVFSPTIHMGQSADSNALIERMQRMMEDALRQRDREKRYEYV